ncbi:helix-turn-helix transcriptional regulator [Gorillibacterium massiliense]|uniref:helix-turn-helix transcriptional regulator n=1 Tax=Gorillibacterium massiliense TaxID=1280390 RepID=UPI001EE2A13A|nr:WYL domain-containing protein [Gorillibacterium massiliense]
MLLLLQHNGRMTTRELAEELKVSPRTIVRDMESLSQTGIPVYAERGPHGGWALVDGFRTSLTGLKKDELLAVLAALSARLPEEMGISASYSSAYRKLIASLPPSARKDADFFRQRLHIDGAGWRRSVEALPYLPIVQEAVWEDAPLQLLYGSAGASARGGEKSAGAGGAEGGGPMWRTVYPLGLVAMGAIWYLAAAGEDGTVRSFRISRIAGAEKLAGTVTRPTGFDLAAYWEQSTAAFQAALPRYPATIRLSPAALPRLRQTRFVKIIEMIGMPQSGEPEKMEEAERAEAANEACRTLLLNVEFNTLESACQIALGFGTELKVVEPPELADAVIVQARQVLEMYENAPAKKTNPPSS